MKINEMNLTALQKMLDENFEAGKNMTENELVNIVCGNCDDWIPQTDIICTSSSEFHRIYKHDRFYHKISWSEFNDSGNSCFFKHDIVVPVEKTIIEYQVLKHDYE
jgi:hypothetical protein